MEHEYYTLWKTFDYILEQLTNGKILSPNSKFVELVEDLKNFSVTLDNKLEKWLRIFNNDKDIVRNMCE